MDKTFSFLKDRCADIVNFLFQVVCCNELSMCSLQLLKYRYRGLITWSQNIQNLHNNTINFDFTTYLMFFHKSSINHNFCWQLFPVWTDQFLKGRQLWDSPPHLWPWPAPQSASYALQRMRPHLGIQIDIWE